jgi:hypothetical protein
MSLKYLRPGVSCNSIADDCWLHDSAQISMEVSITLPLRFDGDCINVASERRNEGISAIIVPDRQFPERQSSDKLQTLP